MWNMDENGPFTNDLAVENGDFPHLCWFTGWQFPHQRGPTKPLLFGLMVVNPKTPHGAQRFPWWLRVISKKKRWLNPTKPYKFMVKYRNDSKWQSFIVSVVTPSWSWDVLGHHITPTMMALMFVTFCWMRMMRMMMMMTTTTTLMIIYIYIYYIYKQWSQLLWHRKIMFSSPKRPRIGWHSHGAITIFHLGPPAKSAIPSQYIRPRPSEVPRPSVKTHRP